MQRKPTMYFIQTSRRDANHLKAPSDSTSTTMRRAAREPHPGQTSRLPRALPLAALGLRTTTFPQERPGFPHLCATPRPEEAPDSSGAPPQPAVLRVPPARRPLHVPPRPGPAPGRSPPRTRSATRLRSGPRAAATGTGQDSPALQTLHPLQPPRHRPAPAPGPAPAATWPRPRPRRAESGDSRRPAHSPGAGRSGRGQAGTEGTKNHS